MTFEAHSNLTAQDVVAYALDGMVTMLCGEQSCVIDARGIAAMIDLIRDKLSEVRPFPAGVKKSCRSTKPNFENLSKLGLFKDEFIRCVSWDNENVIDDVTLALDAFCALVGEHDDKPIKGREVWALANVIRNRLNDFVKGADLAEAIADAHDELSKSASSLAA